MSDWYNLTGRKYKIVKYADARKEGYITIDEVIKELGLSETQTRRVLKKGVLDGKVDQVFCSGVGCRIAMYKLL